MKLDAISVDEAQLPVLTEAEFVEHCRSQGASFIEHKGRYWYKSHAGFYQPSHWMARIPFDKISAPAPLCWGFRSTLADPDRDRANGCMPVNILTDVKAYNLDALDRKVRNMLRKSRRLSEVVVLKNPGLLVDQAYHVYLSSQKRTGYRSVQTQAEFNEGVKSWFSTKSVTLAGLVDGKLAAFIQGYCVDGSAYGDKFYIATEYLTTQVGTALIFDFMQICQHNDAVKEFVYGQHSPEDKNLVDYKERMGFPFLKVPSIVWIHPLMKICLRKLKPYIYYRLTGNDI